MPLDAGSRFGPYEIEAPLGAGGMGQVYRARDTRLQRTVAIKVLPPHVRTDPGLVERFEREAQTISALNHPHICTLYDVGREQDVTYLVMEHLAGETLADRLARGPLPVSQALEIAGQVARALDAAHRQRIVHRDLKPGNIMLIRGGTAPQVKLLDFGLARVQPPSALPQTALTITTPPGQAGRPLTEEGTILGTLQYMSPEQLEGREADGRSDIFALGATLYEMVSGRRPFEADSQAGLVAAILEHEPPPLSAVAVTPVSAAVERLVTRCLVKDPDGRWQSAADFAEALHMVGESQSGAALGMPRPAPQAAPWRARAAWAAATLLVALAAAGAAGFIRAPAASDERVRRLAIEPRGGETFAAGGLALSPDGGRLVYAASRGEQSQLYLRPLDSLEATPIAGTEDGRAPFFSPDGEWVAFFTSDGLKKVSLRGGQPVMLARLPPVARGGTWLPDGMIVFTPSQSAGLVSISAEGGPSTQLTDPVLSADDGAHLWPEVLPGGRDLLITVRTGTTHALGSASIALHSLDTGERHVLASEGAFARYLPSGHVAFVRGDTLMIAPVDLRRRVLTRTPVPLIEGVLVDDLGGPQFAAAPDGTLVYLEGRPATPDSVLVLIDRTGRQRDVLRAPRFLTGPRVAPDGRRVLLTGVTGGIADVWMGDLVDGTLTRVTHQPIDEFNPIWSLDGQRIFYSTFPLGEAPTLGWRGSDGSGSFERIPRDDRHMAQFAGSITPDGRWLAYSQTQMRAGSDIWVVPLAGDGEPRALVSTPFDDYGPEFSPDGRWLSYTSNESGRYEVYVIPFPGPGARRQITRDGGYASRWSHDGSELFFMKEQTLHVVRIGPDLAVGNPKPLFDVPLSIHSTEDHPRAYDLHPDGRHVVTVRSEANQQAAPVRLNVVLGWRSTVARP